MTAITGHLRRLRIVGTRRGLRVSVGSMLAAFGGVAAATQSVGSWAPSVVRVPGPVSVASFCLCIAWGLFRAYPRRRIRRRFRHPDMTVVVEPGDLFEQPAHLVIGFADTFDTSVVRPEIVSRSSLQGQLLDRVYGGDSQRLDAELAAALDGVRPLCRETRRHKRDGKLERYAIGTVAVLKAPTRLILGVAYSRLGNDNIARSSVEDLWYSLNRLWDVVNKHAPQECVAMPLVGSGLARMDFLDRESLLRIILLSFVTRSRERPVCRELHVILQPADLEQVNVPEVVAFLDTLGSENGRR